LKRMEFPDLRRALLPPIMALQSLLAVLAILDAFHVKYNTIINMRGVAEVFRLGFDLTPILLLLISINVAYLLARRRFMETLLLTPLPVVWFHLFGLDASVALTSIPLMVLSLWDTRMYREYVFWILGLSASFEAAALVHWILLPLGIDLPFPWFTDLEHATFAVISALAPFMAIIALCMWIIKPIARPYLRTLEKSPHSRPDANFTREEIRLKPKMLLVLAVAASIVGALYQYSPTLNPESTTSGIDIKNYVEMMKSVEQDPSSVFTVYGSRPLILLTMYALKHILRLEYSVVVRYLPALLNPLLTLSIYAMVYQASGDDEWAGLASLFTALGFKTTVGMFSYFLTNDLGLTFIFLALGFLFKNLRTENRSYPVVASALASLAVFTHPWTFTHFYVAVALFGLILGYRYLKGDSPDRFFTILIFLTVTGAVDVLKGVLIGGAEGFGALASTAPLHLRLDNFWKNNIFTFRKLYGGYLSNLVLFGFAALGVSSLNRKKAYNFFLEVLLAASSIYYLIGHGTVRDLPYNHIPSRLLYNIPFGVLSALAIVILLRNTDLRKKDRMMVLTFFTIYMFVYLLRSLANLVY